MDDSFLDEIDFDDSEISVDPSGSFPVISFSDDLDNLLAKRWSRALVIHLLRRKIGFKALHTRLQVL